MTKGPGERFVSVQGPPLYPPAVHVALFAPLRARQWLHFVVLPAAVLERASRLDAHSVVWRIGLGCVAAALALSYAYGINAITDRSSDEDVRKNPLAGVLVVPRRVHVVVALCVPLALLVSGAIGPASTAATAVSLLASTLYSAGPRLKALPMVGTALNALIFGPMLAFSLRDWDLTPALRVRFASFVVLLLQNQLLHERADLKEDQDAQVLTTAARFGEGAVAPLLWLLGAVGAVLGAFAAPLGVACINGLALVIVTGAVLGLQGGASRRRAVHRWLSIGAGAAIFAATYGPEHAIGH